MVIASLDQAVKVLDDRRQSVANREAAARYLAKNPSPQVMGRLVQALQDDDFGVRWAAAEALVKLGPDILPPILEALTDRERAGDPRLRDSIYHVLHRAQASMPVPVAPLMAALKAPGADIAAIQEAGRLLQALRAKGLA
jgi:HEAT repeat protein